MKMNQHIFNSFTIVAAHYGQQFDVKINIGNHCASTDGKTIYLPNISERFSDKSIIWGYLAHEAAHIRYTNFNVWTLAVQKGDVYKSILNILEDIRIEKALMEHFPGVRRDLNATVKYLKETEGFQAPSDSFGAASLLQCKLLYSLRTSVLHQPLSDFAQSANKFLSRVFTTSFNVKLDVILDAVNHAKSTMECQVLADKIFDLLEEEAKKEKQQDNTVTTDDNTKTLDNATSKKEETAKSKVDDKSNIEHDNKIPLDTNNVRETDNKNPCSQVLASSTNDFIVDAYEVLKDKLNDSSNLNSVLVSNVPIAASTESNVPLANEILAKARKTTFRLRSQLLGLIQSQCKEKNVTKRHGRKLNTKRTSRLLNGDFRLFNKRIEKEQPDTAVHLLTDLSGSMCCSVKLAISSTMAIALSLESIKGVNPAVSYFQGGSEINVRYVVKHGQSVRKHTHNFYHGANGSTPMTEAIWYAVFELSKTKEKKKVIFVITDGVPDDLHSCSNILSQCEKNNIEVIAIGIETDYVKNLFNNYVVIDSIDELTNTLFEHVKKVLVV